MTIKSLDSRLRGNDIRHFFRAMQQRRSSHGVTVFNSRNYANIHYFKIK
ncbi:hypothetical protein [Rickettsia endosymbiont of Aspidapion aeneum]